MSALAVDVMKVISRVTYGDDQGALDLLEALPPADAVRVAFGLATVASGLLGSITSGIERGPDETIAHLMDAATSPP